MPGVDRERRTRAPLELGREARDDVGVFRAGWRVLETLGVGEAGGVEAVALAATAHRGVARLAIKAGPGQHESVIDGEALCDVDRHRVAMQQRRVALDCAAVEAIRRRA